MNQDWVQEYWGQSIKAGVSDAIGGMGWSCGMQGENDRIRKKHLSSDHELSHEDARRISETRPCPRREGLSPTLCVDSMKNRCISRVAHTSLPQQSY